LSWPTTLVARFSSGRGFVGRFRYYINFDWTFDTSGYRGASTSIILDRVRRYTVPGAIVLMHPGAGSTDPQALPSEHHDAEGHGLLLHGPVPNSDGRRTHHRSPPRSFVNSGGFIVRRRAYVPPVPKDPPRALGCGLGAVGLRSSTAGPAGDGASQL